MAITLQDALQRTLEHREIFHDEMLSLMRRIMSGEVSPVMIAALTVGLRVKKETIGEIAAAAQVMREFAIKVDVPERERLVEAARVVGEEPENDDAVAELIRAAMDLPFDDPAWGCARLEPLLVDAATFGCGEDEGEF